MERLDCPHCFTTVLVGDDGVCPHCRKNVRDLQGADTARRKLRAADGDVLPPYCLDCDRPTGRQLDVTGARRPGPETAGNAFVRPLLMVFHALRESLLGVRVPAVSLHVRVHQCEDCAQRCGMVEPFELDAERREMTLLVGREFYERVARERGLRPN